MLLLGAHALNIMANSTNSLKKIRSGNGTIKSSSWGMKLQRLLTVTTPQLEENRLLGKIRREEHICQESAPTDPWLLEHSMSQGSQLKCSISLAFSTFASSKTFIITSFHPTSYLAFQAFRASTPAIGFLCF